MDCVRDHPLIKQVHPSTKVNLNDFIAYWKTCVVTTNKYENAYGKLCDLNRSDIWALYCGFDLKSHDMRLRMDSQMTRSCREKMDSMFTDRGKPIAMLCPVSAVISKSLLPWQIEEVVEACRDLNLVGTHRSPILELEKHGVRGIYGVGLKEWMHYVNAADYVISVDTAAFHLAGGLKKPLTGIFTFANGKTYGKYYDFVLVQRHFDDGDWDCGPCYNYKACPRSKGDIKPCLTDIKRGSIAAAIQDMLIKWPKNQKVIA
jgi:hypothetical protein